MYIEAILTHFTIHISSSCHRLQSCVISFICSSFAVKIFESVSLLVWKEPLQTKSHFIVLYKIALYSHSIQGHQYFSINIVHSVLQPHFMQPRSNLVFAKKEQAHSSICWLFSRFQPGFKGLKYLFWEGWGDYFKLECKYSEMLWCFLWFNKVH